MGNIHLYYNYILLYCGFGSPQICFGSQATKQEVKINLIVWYQLYESSVYCNNHFRQRKLSDAVSIVSSASRISEFSLAPHYLQESPPLFDTTYTMYDPTVDDTFSKGFESKCSSCNISD